MQMRIQIDIEVLKSVHAVTEEEARQIINQTKRVRINQDTLIEPASPKDGFKWKRMDNQSITVEAPPNLGDGLLVIDLINEHGGATTLVYDLKAKKFRQPVPDPEPAASPPTNPQADTQRDLELVLQIGNKLAVNAFLARHPKGFYADLARAQLEKIEAEEAAAKKP
jgi:hypothetical protein